MESTSGKRCQHCNCGKITRDANFKTESLWVDTAQLPRFAPLDKDIAVDVAIIGAGITGVTAALELVKAGKKVAVLEATRVGQGVTGYTTAHITTKIDVEYSTLLSRLGKAKAKIVAESSQAAIEKIKANCADYTIACDLEIVPGYYYSEDGADREYLQKELRATQQVGLDVEWVDSVPLPFATAGGVKFKQQAQFHPLNYLHGLVTAFTAAGGYIYEMTRVRDVQETSSCQVQTERGTVTATHVIMATHAPITKMLSVQSKMETFRSYVVGLVGAPQVAHALFWDTAKPYHYLRRYENNGEAMIIVGGEDHKTGERVDASKRYQRLEKYACRRFPHMALHYEWSAQVYESIDLLPYIGRAPFKKHVYIATGFAGNGMTFGTVAGIIIPALIIKGEHAWAKLYSPNRFSFSWECIKRLTRIGYSNMRHLYLDRFGQGEVAEIAEIGNNEGKVVQLSGKKIAVYKDAHGNVTKLSPVCTHAGCIVAWNNAEHTWDCPCHGGRYNPLGKVINGPPVRDLPVHTA